MDISKSHLSSEIRTTISGFFGLFSFLPSLLFYSSSSLIAAIINLQLKAAVFCTMEFDLLAENLKSGQSGLSGRLTSKLLGGLCVHSITVGSSCLAVNNRQAGEVVSRIERIFENIASSILDEKNNVAINLKTRGKQSMTRRDTDTGIIKVIPSDERKTVRFPSKSPKEAWKFSKYWKSS
jgi:hypothetical protein